MKKNKDILRRYITILFTFGITYFFVQLITHIIVSAIAGHSIFLFTITGVEGPFTEYALLYTFGEAAEKFWMRSLINIAVALPLSYLITRFAIAKLKLVK